MRASCANPLRKAPVLVSLLPPGAVCIVLEFTVSIGALGWSRAPWRWNTSATTAARLVAELEAAAGGSERGPTLHLDLGDAYALLQPDGRVTMASPGSGHFVPWADLPGTMHAALANGLPDYALGVELAAHSHGGVGARADVGIFVLQSPGHHMWQVQALAVKEAWRAGWLRSARLHVMVHHVWDWRPEAWRLSLGEGAWAVFGGIHWCAGYNRYPDLNPRLMGMHRRLTDNYWNKVFTMTQILKSKGYTYLLSLDDDVMLNPASFAALAASGPLGERYGCGVVAPLTQNGIPSAELWAETWLPPRKRSRLFDCFSGSSGCFCNQQCCFPDDALEAEGATTTALQKGFHVPSPWDPASWYRQVGESMALGRQHLHPVRGNLTCMTLALELALELVPRRWADWSAVMPDNQLIVDRDRLFPHLCNNAFLMRSDRYQKVVGHPEIDARTDEVTMNRLLQEGDEPMCFLNGTFGIHPAWGTFGSGKKEQLEDWALTAISTHLQSSMTSQV